MNGEVLTSCRHKNGRRRAWPRVQGLPIPFRVVLSVRLLVFCAFGCWCSERLVVFYASFVLSRLRSMFEAFFPRPGLQLRSRDGFDPLTFRSLPASSRFEQPSSVLVRALCLFEPYIYRMPCVFRVP